MMSPAFSSVWQAGAFALLLLICLLLPILVPSSDLPPRKEVYSSLPWSVGPYGFISHQIYDEQGDIDVAIIGSSRIWCAIATPYLQQIMSEKLGRPARVVSLCWPWAGFDNIYFVARDLLQHRNVHMFVFTDDLGITKDELHQPHPQSWRWFRFGTDAVDLAGFSLKDRLTYYYGSILGMPRNILEMLRPNLPLVLTPNKLRSLALEHHWICPDERLGSLALQMGYGSNPASFVYFSPNTATSPDDVVAFSPETADEFRFEAGVPEPCLQLDFSRKFAKLAHAHGTRLVCLNIPLFTERPASVIQEKYFWPETMRTELTMLGIEPALLFEGMSAADIEKLYWDTYHFNQSGQEYFTRVLAPKLARIYDDAAKN